MSTGTVEVIDLSDLDLDKVPPCNVIKQKDHTVTFAGLPPCKIPTIGECGEPSTARLAIDCQHCGAKGTMFICAPDLELLRVDALRCTKCQSPNFTWKDI